MIGERHAVQGFEFLPEICFEGGTITDVIAMDILELLQLSDEILFKSVFRHRNPHFVAEFCSGLATSD